MFIQTLGNDMHLKKESPDQIYVAIKIFGPVFSRRRKANRLNGPSNRCLHRICTDYVRVDEYPPDEC